VIENVRVSATGLRVKDQGRLTKSVDDRGRDFAVNLEKP